MHRPLAGPSTHTDFLFPGPSEEGVDNPATLTLQALGVQKNAHHWHLVFLRRYTSVASRAASSSIPRCRFQNGPLKNTLFYVTQGTYGGAGEI